MNTITFTLPWLPILVGMGGLSGTVFLYSLVRRLVRRYRVRTALLADHRRDVAKAAEQVQQYNLQCIKEKAEANHKKLFPSPWDTAYEICENAKTWTGAKTWLQKWLDQQPVGRLPCLTLEAVEKFTFTMRPEDASQALKQEMVDIFAPYWDTGFELYDDLEANLPKAWYDFWAEIKDFPARRSLFVDKIAKLALTPHPVTKTLLTPKQATLLARALSVGSDSGKAEYYARDLAKYVVIPNESEKEEPQEANNNIVTRAVGDSHSLGLKADDSIVARGYNHVGLCDVPEPSTGFVAVVGGPSHSLGLKADGSIVAWGRNTYGQCDVPAPNEDFVAVASGFFSSLGLKADGSIVAWGRYNENDQKDVTWHHKIV